MPIVNIKVTDEGVTVEQKRALVAGVSALLHEVLGKEPSRTFVIIEEVSTDNWGVNGETVADRRARDSTAR